MSKTVTVFAGSSDVVAGAFLEAGHELGAHLARRGFKLVYGGGNIGLMGSLARAMRSGGGHIVGVIPERLNRPGIVYDNCDELIVTKDLRERKTIMEAKSDAFIALPGGLGTLEEFMELLTLKQLHFHTKPLVLLNVAHFYDPLMQMFEHVYEHHFAKPSTRNLYLITPFMGEALDYIEQYKAEDIETKWY